MNKKKWKFNSAAVMEQYKASRRPYSARNTDNDIRDGDYQFVEHIDIFRHTNSGRNRFRVLPPIGEDNPQSAFITVYPNYLQHDGKSLRWFDLTKQYDEFREDDPLAHLRAQIMIVEGDKKGWDIIKSSGILPRINTMMAYVYDYNDPSPVPKVAVFPKAIWQQIANRQANTGYLFDCMETGNDISYQCYVDILAATAYDKYTYHTLDFSPSTSFKSCEDYECIEEHLIKKPLSSIILKRNSNGYKKLQDELKTMIKEKFPRYSGVFVPKNWEALSDTKRVF